ncbi:hypothetical protein O0L34_g12959 [Tuta absoluta]|nr:hypothetical protein O0L34_g12959 [Tuta absoluta]
MIPINISAAFKKCGIFPFDPDIFEDIDFMPSLSVIPIRKITPPLAVAECSSSGTKGKFIPPKEFMPPLKAGPRSGGRKPRKLGRSLIATDTPEKNEITEARNKAKQRKSAAKKAKRLVLTDKKRK